MADKPFSWGSNISKVFFFSLCIGYFAKPYHTNNRTVHLSSYQPHQSPLSNHLTVHSPSSAELFMDAQTAGPQRHSKETQGHRVPHILFFFFYFQLVYVDMLSIQNL